MRTATRSALALAAAGALSVTTAASASAHGRPSDAGIVETAVGLSGGVGAYDDNDGDFDLLVAALVESGLVAAFDGGADYTVLAPTDGAFLALLGTDDEVAAASAIAGLADENPAFLADVLLYHVTEGVRLSTSVTRAKQVRMLNGDTISARQGFVDGASSDAGFLATDIRVADGAVHVIETVLLP